MQKKIYLLLLISVFALSAGAQNLVWNTFTSPDSSFKFRYPTLWGINQVVPGTLVFTEPNTQKGVLKFTERSFGLDSAGLYKYLASEFDRHAGSSYKMLGDRKVLTYINLNISESREYKTYVWLIPGPQYLLEVNYTIPDYLFKDDRFYKEYDLVYSTLESLQFKPVKTADLEQVDDDTDDD